jgi:hypothetical protein
LLLVSNALSNAEAKQLLQLCKTGRLFDVQNWISSGNSLSVPAELKTTPLSVALDTGFYSLVELLVRNEPSRQLKNRSLRHAVSLKRLDLIELLVSHGAEISSVPFVEVLLLWDPTIIRYFLDHGADFITGYPFAEAFAERIRTALRPWRECREKYPHLAPQLQEQADRALRYFCFKDDLKWVSLLMWAGADPRSSGPAWGDDEDFDDEKYSSALTAAAYSKNVEILKRLKPDAKKNDLDNLLACAATFGRVETVRYLLDLGNQTTNPMGVPRLWANVCLRVWDLEVLDMAIVSTAALPRPQNIRFPTLLTPFDFCLNTVRCGDLTMLARLVRCDEICTNANRT